MPASKTFATLLLMSELELKCYLVCLQSFYSWAKCRRKMLHLTSILIVYVICELLGGLLDKLYTEAHF